MSLINLVYNKAEEFCVANQIAGTLQIIMEEAQYLNHYYIFSDKVTVKKSITNNFILLVFGPLCKYFKKYPKILKILIQNQVYGDKL